MNIVILIHTISGNPKPKTNHNNPINHSSDNVYSKLMLVPLRYNTNIGQRSISEDNTHVQNSKALKGQNTIT
jgi:hypothetical protein